MCVSVCVYVCVCVCMYVCVCVRVLLKAVRLKVLSRNVNYGWAAAAAVGGSSDKRRHRHLLLLPAIGEDGCQSRRLRVFGRRRHAINVSYDRQ